SAQGPRLRAQLDSESRTGTRVLPGARAPRVHLLQQSGHAGAHPGRHAVRARRPEGRRQSEQEEVGTIIDRRQALKTVLLTLVPARLLAAPAVSPSIGDGPSGDRVS